MESRGHSEAEGRAENPAPSQRRNAGQASHRSQPSPALHNGAEPLGVSDPKDSKPHKRSAAVGPSSVQARSNRRPDGRNRDVHDSLIREYLARFPEARTVGFAKAIWEIVGAESDFRYNLCHCTSARKKCECVREAFPETFPIPDAFDIDRRWQVLTVMEAQDTCPMDGAKLNRYVELFWLLDAGGWHLAIHLVDRNGSIFTVDTVQVAIQYLNEPPPARFGRLPGKLLDPNAPPMPRRSPVQESLFEVPR